VKGDSRVSQGVTVLKAYRASEVLKASEVLRVIQVHSPAI
jgi:hypothetical protein